MDKPKNFFMIIIPSATVFLSSACVMIIELVASRLIARNLGSSLYTWTTVIGVVLAGITIGNYIGGRIADKFHARKALSALFLLCSVACVFIVVLNNVVGDWMWLWHLSWPVRTFCHVSLVFLIPSALLGTISPVVAKMALDRGLQTGRTVGDIYAWGAAGSIAGTFVAGFYLIAMMGTISIVWTVGSVLLLLAIFYWVRFWPVHLVWAILFIILLTAGIASADWSEQIGSALSLRAEHDPNIIYEDETQYCYVSVKRVSANPEKRLFMQDKLKHSEIIMGDINNLQYFHTIIFAAVTHGLKDNQKISVMHIGGGGYVFPQYIEKNFPDSRNDVAEIDAAVTEAARQAFGLSRDTTINTITMDARNCVDDLIAKRNMGEKIELYDFIYEDAFSDYSVPFQLVTKEFNDKIYEILTDDGVYMINSIDSYASGRFVGAYINTLEQTFPYVYIIAVHGPKTQRKIFVLIASKQQFDPGEFTRRYRPGLDFWYLNVSEMETLKAKASGMVLSDDYVPVENLLAPVVQQGGIDLLVGKYRKQAKELMREGRFDKSIAKYRKMIELDPTMSIEAYNQIALIYARQGRLELTTETFRKALAYNEQAEFKSNMANIYLSLGVALKQLGKTEQARQAFNDAVEGYKEELQENSKSVKTLLRLGDALAENGRFLEAADYFGKAVELNPVNPSNHIKLIQTLEFGGRIDLAVSANQRAVIYFSRYNPAVSARLQKYLEALELKQSGETDGPGPLRTR